MSTKFEIRGHYPHQHVHGKFWLVVSGAAYTRGGGPDRANPKLQNGGTTLHATFIEARAEAERLASESRGTPFYVVEAVHFAQSQTIVSQAL